VIRQRVERASELLQSGRSSIAHVARDVGFADQSHLHRHFKRVLGVNPADVLPADQNVQCTDQNVQDRPPGSVE
jgi:AraC family transcriptional regulator